MTPEQLFPDRTVIGVLRGSSADVAFGQAMAAIEAGLRALEVTFTVPGAASVIERLRAEAGDRCRIGAGTVLSARQAAEAVSAGADYLVSPNLDVTVIKAARDAGVPHVPGIMTPTELQAARQAGCSLLKVFPVASLGGPGYLQNLLGPYPDARLLATGGVGLNDVGRYFAAGARLVGLGAIFGNDEAETRTRTRNLLEELML